MTGESRLRVFFRFEGDIFHTHLCKSCEGLTNAYSL